MNRAILFNVIHYIIVTTTIIFSIIIIVIVLNEKYQIQFVQKIVPTYNLCYSPTNIINHL